MGLPLPANPKFALSKQFDACQSPPSHCQCVSYVHLTGFLVGVNLFLERQDFDVGGLGLEELLELELVIGLNLHPKVILGRGLNEPN